LVQDVDKHLPAVAALLDQFSFLPRWRIDDIMISYAAPGGSVGPHFDNYDVFLLQGQGHRRWHIGPRPARPRFLPDSELQVLQNFRPQREIVAAAGDVLYLPPHLAHHGVAEDECITLSVGFRAPSQRELAFAFAEELLGSSSDQLRYSDPDLRLQGSPGAIDPRAFARVRKLLGAALKPEHNQLERWFARHVTEPKPHLVRARTAGGLSKSGLRARLEGGATLEHALGTRWAYFSSGKLWLYVDGEEWALSARLLPLVKLLCDAPRCAAAQLEPLMARVGSDTLLHDLAARGLLVVSPRAASRRKR
jgi:50S ribosomal protein L16 3-hydroxylase